MYSGIPAAAIVLVCSMPAACGPKDPASVRKAEIIAILQAHLEHEDALLDILEQHRDDPPAADAHLEAYIAEHGAEIAELCAQRRTLEADPNALALAMRELEGDMRSMFERRRDLDARYPELMAREEVRTALGALDAL